MVQRLGDGRVESIDPGAVGRQGQVAVVAGHSGALWVGHRVGRDSLGAGRLVIDVAAMVGIAADHCAGGNAGGAGEQVAAAEAGVLAYADGRRRLVRHREVAYLRAALADLVAVWPGQVLRGLGEGQQAQGEVGGRDSGCEGMA